MAELSLDPQWTALIAIDLQNAIIARGTAPHSVVDVVNKNFQIAAALRSRGGLIVWVRVDINRLIRLRVDQPPPFDGQQQPGYLMEISPTAGLQVGDLVITKHHWGAFAGTRLEELLKARGIRTVILTGVSTSVGVESTLRQGTGLGFSFAVVEDACSGQQAVEHRFAIETIFPRLSRVRATNEVLKSLA